MVKDLNKINEDVCIRNRKINFIDMQYFSSLYNSNSKNTYDNVYNKLIIDNDYDNISKNAFIKKRDDIDISHFEKINSNLLNYIYNDVGVKERLIAVDGSQLNFLKSLDTHFKLNKHETYTYGLLSCLYDVDLQIPINYELSNSSNERNVLIEQLKHLKLNDILIADRGYYSNDVINKLFDSNINFVFRLKLSDINVKEMNKQNLDEFIYNFNDDINKQVKIVKYTTYINNDKEILKYNIDDLKKEYIDNKKYINNLKLNINNLINEKKLLIKENTNISLIIKNNICISDELNEILLIDKKRIIKRKKEIKNDMILFNELLNQTLKLNKSIVNKIKSINKINDSTYYIITNKINFNTDKIKSIYKKRW